MFICLQLNKVKKRHLNYKHMFAHFVTMLERLFLLDIMNLITFESLYKNVQAFKKDHACWYNSRNGVGLISNQLTLIKRLQKPVIFQQSISKIGEIAINS